MCHLNVRFQGPTDTISQEAWRILSSSIRVHVWAPRKANAYFASATHLENKQFSSKRRLEGLTWFRMIFQTTFLSFQPTMVQTRNACARTTTCAPTNRFRFCDCAFSLDACICLGKIGHWFCPCCAWAQPESTKHEANVKHGSVSKCQNSVSNWYYWPRTHTNPFIICSC